MSMETIEIKQQSIIAAKLEIIKLEEEIILLKNNKKTKEYLVDDLQSLLNRVSEEYSFLIPFKLGSSCELKLEQPVQLSEEFYKGTRKYSDNSGISSHLSKCASHTTKASSCYNDDEMWLKIGKKTDEDKITNINSYTESHFQMAHCYWKESLNQYFEKVNCSMNNSC